MPVVNWAVCLGSGHLKKLTAGRTVGGWGSREWKERWIVLRSDTIAVYRQNRGDQVNPAHLLHLPPVKPLLQKAKGSIARGFCIGIYASGEAAYAKACPDPKKKWGISIMTGDTDLDYHMEAASEREHTEWYQMLMQWHKVDSQ